MQSKHALASLDGHFEESGYQKSLQQIHLAGNLAQTTHTQNRVKTTKIRHSSTNVHWSMYRGTGAGRWAESSSGARVFPDRPLACACTAARRQVPEGTRSSPCWPYRAAASVALWTGRATARRTCLPLVERVVCRSWGGPVRAQHVRHRPDSPGLGLSWGPRRELRPQLSAAARGRAYAAESMRSDGGGGSGGGAFWGGSCRSAGATKTPAMIADEEGTGSGPSPPPWAGVIGGLLPPHQWFGVTLHPDAPG